MVKDHRKQSVFGSNLATTMKDRRSTGIISSKLKLDVIKAVSLPIILVINLLIAVLSGCYSPSQIYYENKQWNFSLEYPDNWELREDSRIANDFSLQGRNGLLNKGNARIVITSGFLIPEGTPNKLEITMENHLTGIAHMTHIFRSLEVLQISEVTNTHNHEMIWATISVPTLDIAEGSPVNQMGQRGENLSQIIDIYILRNSQGQDIVVEVYKDADADLNAQADEIVKSIQFINE